MRRVGTILVLLGAALPVAAQETAAPARPAYRSVAPEMVAPPPVDPSTLERIEARPPLSTIAPALPLPPKPAKPILHKPVVISSGVLTIGPRTVTIADVEPLDVDETCPTDEGGTWHCGRAARTAFRALLRSRAVTCAYPPEETETAITVACTVGPVDIGKWLVRNGWARASGDTYRAEAQAALAARKGIHGRGPGTLPSEPDLPISQLPAPPAIGDADTISILPRFDAQDAEPEEVPDEAPGEAPLPAPVRPGQSPT